MVDALIMVVVVVSMVALGVLVWNRVNAQERGDHELERRLHEDDRRAENGRRRLQGLPPLPPSGSRAVATEPLAPAAQPPSGGPAGPPTVPAEPPEQGHAEL